MEILCSVSVYFVYFLQSVRLIRYNWQEVFKYVRKLKQTFVHITFLSFYFDFRFDFFFELQKSD